MPVCLNYPTYLYLPKIKGKKILNQAWLHVYGCYAELTYSVLEFLPG